MDQIFQGFEESKKRFSSLPNQFFSELLPAIDDINELKITIYMLWLAYTQGDYGTAFRVKDFLLDKTLMKGLHADETGNDEFVRSILEQAVQRGSVIRVDGDEAIYFINSPRGRQAAKLMEEEHTPESKSGPKATLDIIQPNIFKLYEENIGPLTPIIADELRDAQESYPLEWIEEAIQLAVKNNVRRWKYVESILTRWQEEGKDGTHRRDDQEDYRRYLKGKYGEIGQH